MTIKRCFKISTTPNPPQKLFIYYLLHTSCCNKLVYLKGLFPSLTTFLLLPHQNKQRQPYFLPHTPSLSVCWVFGLFQVFPFALFLSLFLSLTKILCDVIICNAARRFHKYFSVIEHGISCFPLAFLTL